MGGTAVIICLQQLKGFFGLTHFTSKTDLISVMKAIFSHKDEVTYMTLCVIFGISFLATKEPPGRVEGIRTHNLLSRITQSQCTKLKTHWQIKILKKRRLWGSNPRPRG